MQCYGFSLLPLRKSQAEALRSSLLRLCMAVNAVSFWSRSCMTVRRAKCISGIVNDYCYVYLRLLDVCSSACLLISLTYKFFSSSNTKNILWIRRGAFSPSLSNSNSFRLLTFKLNIPLVLDVGQSVWPTPVSCRRRHCPSTETVKQSLSQSLLLIFYSL